MIRNSSANYTRYSEDFLPMSVGRRATAARLRRTASLLAALVDAGFAPAAQIARVEPGSAGRRVARRLGVPQGTPLLVVRGALRDDGGRPLNAFRLHVRAGYGLQMHLSRVGDPAALVGRRD